MNLELFFRKIPPLVKLIAVYLFSIVSFLILDFMLSFGGPDPIGFIVYSITRAGLAVLISSLFFGIQVFNSPKLRIDFVLAMLIFGIPIISFTEILRNLFGIFIKIPPEWVRTFLSGHTTSAWIPPYVSLMRFTLIMALFYEFPRLILFLAIKRSLYGTREQREVPAEGVR